MVAEKPIVAESIANFISNGNYKEKSNFFDWIVYEFTGNFQGKAANFTVAPTNGHITGKNKC